MRDCGAAFASQAHRRRRDVVCAADSTKTRRSELVRNCAVRRCTSSSAKAEREKTREPPQLRGAIHPTKQKGQTCRKGKTCGRMLRCPSPPSNSSTLEGQPKGRETQQEGSQGPRQESQERRRHQDVREQQDETPASQGAGSSESKNERQAREALGAALLQGQSSATISAGSSVTGTSVSVHCVSRFPKVMLEWSVRRPPPRPRLRLQAIDLPRVRRTVNASRRRP